MRSDFGLALRRLKPHKHLDRLVARLRDTLPFVDLSRSLPKNLLLDSTVYIDELQGRLPADVETLLRAATLWHSPVTAAELAIAVGHLEPRDARTQRAVETIAGSLARRPSHRTLSPDSQTWIEAALASGILARLQNYAPADRSRALNDALLLFTAYRHGCTVLTRNVVDFDFLLQIAPGARVLFYRIR